MCVSVSYVLTLAIRTGKVIGCANGGISGPTAIWVANANRLRRDGPIGLLQSAKMAMGRFP